MKKLICLLMIVVMTISLCATNINVSANEISKINLVDIADKVKILSRAAITEQGVEADFAGGGFAVSLNCEGNVSLNLDWSGNVGMFTVIINDDVENAKNYKISAEGEHSITIGENLEKDDYTFEIIKANSQYNQIVFKSLSFTGTVNEKPGMKKLKLEFYGDSFSCGVGAFPGNNGILGYQDSAIHSYNFNCARYLDAEIKTCAIPGYGYAAGYASRENTIYPYIDKALFHKDVKYDNSQYIADIVVIALGTNDYNYIRGHEDIIEDEEIDAVVQKYIDTIRSYNKDCYILLLGNIGNGSFNVGNRVGNHYIKLDNALIRAAGTNEKTLYYTQIGMSYTGVNYHPKASEAERGGKLVAEFIKENFLSGKPLPPVVSDSDFYLNCDVNKDDRINTIDVLSMRNYLSKKQFRIEEKYADVNRDGKVGMQDTLRILKYLAQL
ncbi:MAG: hypothetical protein IIU65_02340 [Clostridia bacterium]|nr:hypothetical protein [Clostridia bacterium]